MQSQALLFEARQAIAAAKQQHASCLVPTLLNLEAHHASQLSWNRLGASMSDILRYFAMFRPGRSAFSQLKKRTFQPFICRRWNLMEAPRTVAEADAELETLPAEKQIILFVCSLFNLFKTF